MVRTGSTAGHTGPTIILLKGEKCRPRFTDNFLERHGLAPGSTIIMTPNAYMTDEAWLLATKAIVKGYRSMPGMKDNPQWMMVELLDGFGSHERVLEAHELRTKFLITSAKEESTTSHANQGYDQFVAKNDKKVAAETLYTQRKITRFISNRGGRIDQYDLVFTTIALVTATTPKIWIASYDRTNLNPLTRVDFHVWCRERINRFLQAGEAFHPEAVHPTAIELYALLPPCWHGMTPCQKKEVFCIFTQHQKSYSPACLRQLHKDCKLPYSNMGDIRVCLVLAEEHPEMLDMQLPSKESLPMAAIANLEDARKAVAPLNSDLSSFQLKPRGANGELKLKGEALFAHMILHRNVMTGKKGSRDVECSHHLDISVGRRQMECIQPTAQELTRGQIIKDAVGDGAKLKVARRKLNSIGNMHGHCAILNSDRNLKCMRDDLQLTDAIAEISRGDAMANAARKEEEESNLLSTAGIATKKLEEKNRDVNSVTVKEIQSILFAVYNVTLTGSKLRKPDFVSRLKVEMEKNLGKYTRFLLEERSPEKSAIVVMPVAIVAPTFAIVAPTVDIVETTANMVQC